MNIDTQLLPEGTPMMAKVKHPLRHSINGDTHTIEELKKIVDETEISDSLKAFIQEDFTGQSGVFYFGTEMSLPANVKPGDVSDHDPVWAKFFTGKDTDHP